VFTAGMRLRASHLTAMQPLYVRKVTDESLVSSTTLQDDNSLLLPVEANAVYELDAVIYYSTRSDTDIKMQWTLPSGFMEWIAYGLASGATGTSGSVVFERQFLSSTPVFGGAGAENSTFLSVSVKGSIHIGTTPGNMRLRWAQNVSNATATIVRGDSFMVLKRLN